MKLQEAIAQKRKMSTDLLGSTRNIVSSFSLNEVLTFENFHSLSNINGVGVVPKGNDEYSLRVYTQQETEPGLLTGLVASHYSVSADEVEIVRLGRVRPFAPQISRHRPAEPGYSIGHFAITAGTFGCVVSKDGNFYILSNNHVLANQNNSAIGDNIMQPGPADGGTQPKDIIATLADFEPLMPGRNNSIDAAIAQLTDPTQASSTIAGIGNVMGISGPTSEMRVKKSGRTTGFTQGRISALSVDIQVQFDDFVIQFIDQFEVRANAGFFSRPGDSGSLIVSEDTNNAIGLLFAGNDEGVTFVNPISTVLARFGVQIV